MRVEERRRDPLEPRLELDSQHSWSRERLEALCLSLPCRASPRQPMHAGRWVSMPVGLAESRPDATAQPCSLLCQDHGSGAEAQKALSPWDLGSLGGNCRPAKLRHPREQGFGFRLYVAFWHPSLWQRPSCYF